MTEWVDKTWNRIANTISKVTFFCNGLNWVYGWMGECSVIYFLNESQFEDRQTNFYRKKTGKQ